MRRATKGFEEKEKIRVSKLTNLELYDELLNIAGGDDYDGCFTPDGNISYAALHQEMNRRLVVCGFLNEMPK